MPEYLSAYSCDIDCVRSKPYFQQEGQPHFHVNFVYKFVSTVQNTGKIDCHTRKTISLSFIVIVI